MMGVDKGPERVVDYEKKRLATAGSDFEYIEGQRSNVQHQLHSLQNVNRTVSEKVLGKADGAFFFLSFPPTLRQAVSIASRPFRPTVPYWYGNRFLVIPFQL